MANRPKLDLPDLRENRGGESSTANKCSSSSAIKRMALRGVLKNPKKMQGGKKKKKTPTGVSRIWDQLGGKGKKFNRAAQKSGLASPNGVIIDNSCRPRKGMGKKKSGKKKRKRREAPARA